MSSDSPAETALSVIGQDVRRNAPGRFLTALFAPAARREDLLTLYAFFADVGRVREQVREPGLGQIRLQWWRECLDTITTTGHPPAGHPLSQGLARVIQDYALDPQDLLAVLAAHDSTLNDPPLADRAALDAHCRVVGGTEARMAVQILSGEGGHNPSREARQSLLAGAEQVGAAVCLTECLRRVGLDVRQGRPTLLPAGALGGHAHLQTEAAQAKARILAQALYSEARLSLKQARAHLPRPPKETIAAFLPALHADGLLSSLRRCDFDLLHPRLLLPHRRPLAVTLKAIRGRY